MPRLIYAFGGIIENGGIAERVRAPQKLRAIEEHGRAHDDVRFPSIATLNFPFRNDAAINPRPRARIYRPAQFHVGRNLVGPENIAR
jgi:hypothetical protein